MLVKIGNINDQKSSFRKIGNIYDKGYSDLIEKDKKRQEIIQKSNADSEKYAKEAEKYQGIADTLKGIAEGFVRPFISIAEIPKLIMTGGKEGFGRVNVPGIGETQSYQEEFRNVQNDIIEGKKPLYSALAPIGKAVLDTASLGLGGKIAGKGAEMATKQGVKLLSKEGLKQTAKIGAEGAIYGAGYGGVSIAENPGMTAQEKAGTLTGSTILGAGISAGLHSGVSVFGKAIGGILQKYAKKDVVDFDIPTAIETKNAVEEKLGKPLTTEERNALTEAVSKGATKDEIVKAIEVTKIEEQGYNPNEPMKKIKVNSKTRALSKKIAMMEKEEKIRRKTIDQINRLKTQQEREEFFQNKYYNEAALEFFDPELGGEFENGYERYKKLLARFYKGRNKDVFDSSDSVGIKNLLEGRVSAREIDDMFYGGDKFSEDEILDMFRDRLDKEMEIKGMRFSPSEKIPYPEESPRLVKAKEELKKMIDEGNAVLDSEKRVRDAKVKYEVTGETLKTPVSETKPKESGIDTVSMKKTATEAQTSAGEALPKAEVGSVKVGDGKKKPLPENVSQTAKRIEDTYGDRFDVETGYDRMSIKKELDKASESIMSDIAKAKQEAFSQISDLKKRRALQIEFFDKARKERRWEDARDIAAKLNAESTETAQVQNLNKAYETANPQTSYVKEVINARLANIKDVAFVKGKEKLAKAREVLENTKKEIRSATKISTKDAQELFDSLLC